MSVLDAPAFIRGGVLNGCLVGVEIISEAGAVLARAVLQPQEAIELGAALIETARELLPPEATT